MRVDVYSRHDAYVGTIGARQLLGFVWTDCLNGEDTVDITTTFPLKEGYRLVWKDLNGVPHEHVCQDPQGASAAGLPIYSDTALNSICELFGDYIEDKRPYGYSFQRALEVCLEPTRWDVGTVDQPGTVSSGLTFYHTDCRTALNDILACGGELETSITVGASGVTGRRVSILKHRGEANGHRRFSYGKDINSIKRTEHWGAITACYGYGKGVETDNGGYGRKLTFGDINGGKDYVEDATALKTYGRPDGKGGFAHVFGKYENSSCEDASQLKSETQAYLDEHKNPGVTYEVDVVDLVTMGRKWEGVGVGDDSQIVDGSFEPTLRCQGRVTKQVIDMLGKTRTVTLGNVTESIADILQQQQQQITNLQNQSGSWDAVASTTPAFLQQLIDSLNEQFNVNGMSYMHLSYQNGFIFSSVPLDEDGQPTATGGTAMQLCSLGFRIADGTKADGSYDWRTFGTGAGFVADWITTGTLLANLIKAGRLLVGDPNDPVFMADFDSGEVVISATASVGNKTAGEMVVSTDVQYGLSDSASTQPTTWSTTALWAQGKHLWTRVKMELADGTIEYTTPRRIANENGIGAAEVIEQYYLSTSSTTQTGGYWSNTQPAWVSGRYYWTRSRIKWSNGTYTYTDPVLARGLTSGNQSTDNLDASLTQQDVFNRLTNNGQTQGIYLSNGRIYINGEYIKADTISTKKIESYRGSSLYTTVGTTQGGNPGTSFVNAYGNYLDIEALHASDDASKKTTGLGLACFDKPFLHASTYYDQLWLHPPLIKNTYMQHPGEQLYMRGRGGGAGQSTPYVELQRTNSQGVFIGEGYIELALDSTHYVYINSRGVQCRCGSHGFGWVDGKFSENLVW
ncbi:MAG: phage tail protein [Coriobacteriaceae bacterium]|uniref:phage tail spike protein n=1 Tax=Tractidigestivibacter sp. TaxID=2847320 RepID=UPI002A7FF9AB|nr:phage tail spike protein [Tractidigestivibacter sp.]MCI6274435.1 phage tail protein [Coriobacteriaceae bacterium]MCI6548188.1 phage tail protein [Coriobacteriaceae bacterium]MCI6845312.1 phage tail protein [Coriobacteriaceae bacterium]MDY4535493.1 phage tail spike protein [Tractidigestivibacter sp.]MDY5272122.1 phage tail spike protein [Tractidigestivibacter sp.]